MLREESLSGGVIRGVGSPTPPHPHRHRSRPSRRRPDPDPHHHRVHRLVAGAPNTASAWGTRDQTSPLVGATGIEPVASSVSGKRSPAELSARSDPDSRPGPSRRRPELNRGRGFCRPLPNHSATPPCLPDPAGAATPTSFPAWGPHPHTGPCLPDPPDRRGATAAAPPSGRPVSNRRPSPWQGDALPTELRPRGRSIYQPPPFAQEPVEPSPPSPRVESGSSSTTSNSWVCTATTTSWAMRSPRTISTGSSPRLTRMTLISPR